MTDVEKQADAIVHAVRRAYASSLYPNKGRAG